MLTLALACLCRYGVGVHAYFSFAKAMIVMNIILFIPAVIGYFVAVKGADRANFKGVSQLFVGAYPPSAVKAWKGTSVVLILEFLACMYAAVTVAAHCTVSSP